MLSILFTCAFVKPGCQTGTAYSTSGRIYPLYISNKSLSDDDNDDDDDDDDDYDDNNNNMNKVLK